LDKDTAAYEQAWNGKLNIEDEVSASTHINLGRISLLREITVTQLNHWAFYPVMLVVCALFNTGKQSPVVPDAFLWLFMGIIPILFYFFRTKIKTFPVLVLCHILTVVAVKAVLSNAEYTNVYMLAGIVYIVNSVALRLKTSDFQDLSFPMPVAVGISAASLFFLKYLWGGNWFEVKIIVAFIVVFGMSMLRTYLESYINFLIVNRSSTGHIPAKEIFTSGLFMAVLSAILMMLLMILTSGIGWLSTILGSVGAVVSAILRVLFSLMGTGESDIYVDDTQKDFSVSGIDPADSEPAMIWQILTVIAFIAIAFMFLYLLIMGIRKMYLYIKERMSYTGAAPDDGQLYSVRDVREKCTVDSKGSHDRLAIMKMLFDRLSPAEKIRQLYRKNILRYNESDIAPGLLTADEWGERLNIPEMSVIYDKARYSDMEISTEDVKMFRKSFINLKS
jgi:hypothetical protein